MQAIQTLPTSATEAKLFIAPGSLSYPGAAQELTPPVAQFDANSQKPTNYLQQPPTGAVTPATPAATPVGNQGPSGITPTLQ